MQESWTSGPVADFNAALARLDNNRELLCEMMTFFREDVPGLVEKLESSVADKHADDAKRAAHSIKGLAAGFNGARVQQIAFTIEQLAQSGKLREIPALLPPLRVAIAELEAAFDDYDS